MKLSAADCLAILRLFQLADESNVPREVERIHASNPSSTNTLVSFRFKRREYVLLLDDTAEDDQDYIMQQIQISLPGREGELLENPRSDVATFGAPYKGKDIYMFALGDAKQRLDVYLADAYPAESRSTWQKHIKSGYVSVNGTVRQSPKFMIESDDKVVIDLPAATDHSDKQFDIIYIDDDVIVIDKPTGVLTHRKNDIDDEFTAAEFFARYTSGSVDDNRPGVVHRLDRDTSGVMIGARTPEAYEHLKAQFADRLVGKTYIAITDGLPKAHEAAIDLPIMRSRTRPGSFVVDQKGKPAQTSYQIIGSTDSHARVKLQPRTGRTHQLRVHMAYLGTPIVGDRLYGKPGDRLYLHAHQLELKLPSGQAKTFTSPVPVDFDSLVKEAEGAD